MRKTISQNILKKSYDALFGFGIIIEFEMRWLMIEINIYIGNIDNVVDIFLIFDDCFKVFPRNSI